MRNRKFMAGMLVIALVFGMMVVSCGGIGGGTFTITDIPEKFNGKYAVLAAVKLGENSWVVTGAQSLNAKQAKLSRISNGKVSMPTWKCYGSNGETFTKVERYSGSDTFIVTVAISDKSEVSGKATLEPSDTVGTAMFMSVKFSNGSAAESWKTGLSTDFGDLFKGLGL